MTTHAIGAGTAVIKHGRGPIAGVMAGIAGIAAGNVIGGFTRRAGAVMATGTGAELSTMDDACEPRPTARTVTALAAAAALNVPGRLAGRGTAVMATRAITTDIGMIELRRGPAAGVVASLAGIAALNMIG